MLKFKSKNKETEKESRLRSIFKKKHVDMTSAKARTNIMIQRVLEAVIVVFSEYILGLAVCIYAIPIASAYIAGTVGLSANSNFLDALAYFIFPCMFVTGCLIVLTVFAGRKLFKIIDAMFAKSIQKQKDKLSSDAK